MSRAHRADLERALQISEKLRQSFAVSHSVMHSAGCSGDQLLSGSGRGVCVGKLTLRSRRPPRFSALIQARPRQEHAQI